MILKNRNSRMYLSEGRLSDYADVGTNMPNADFWIKRKGSEDTVGEPTMDYSPEHIGVKVRRTDALHPKYLFYMFKNLHLGGLWRRIATGTTNLLNIKTDHVKNMKMGD